MKTTVNGLVLREIKTGEADRILHILTQEHGVISASAKGSMRPKSKLFSATGLFCYSSFTLFEGRTMFSINEASPQEVFFGLRNSIEGVALATYIAELLRVLSPTGDEAQRLLRLALNSFYLLSEGKKDPALVKAVFELRSFSESGFMPDLLACCNCGKYEDERLHFDAFHGHFYCKDCAGEKRLVLNIDTATLAAMRHIALSTDDKVYNFTLTGNSLVLLQHAAEEYVMAHLDYVPKSLAFLKTVL